MIALYAQQHPIYAHILSVMLGFLIARLVPFAETDGVDYTEHQIVRALQKAGFDDAKVAEIKMHLAAIADRFAADFRKPS